MASSQKMTRGHGVLEGFLATQRAHRANRLIPETFRGGRILDIGCGSYPLFLLGTTFAEKYGVEKLHLGAHNAIFDASAVRIVHADIESDPALPFDDDYFDVVTMLAVFEHIDPAQLEPLLREIRRILKPGGMYLMTTPAVWTRGLLWMLSRLRLLSSEEIDEHKGSYSRAGIFSVLESAGFPRWNLHFGHFEVFMNVWATATK